MLVLAAVGGCAAAQGRGGAATPGQATSTTSVPAAAPVEIPFALVRNQIAVAVRIGGRGPFTFLLDTGVNPSAVDLVTARQLGLPLDTSQAHQAEGAGSGAAAIYPALVTGLELGGARGGVRVDSVEAAAMDMAALAARFGRPLHGILGHSFLRGRAVQIDYPARVLRLLPPGTPADALVARAGPDAPRDVLRVPMTFASGTIPRLVVRVNGAEIPVSLDTGSSLTLELFPAAVRRLGLEAVRARADTSSLVGARGRAATRDAEVDSVGLGPWVRVRPRVTFSDRALDEANAGRLGNLGNGFLRDYVLTLDYLRREITIARPSRGYGR